MIVDTHTHWGRAWIEQAVDDPAEWLAVLDRYGVTHAVVMPEIGLMDPGRIAADHDLIAAACAKSGGRMLPTCTAFPYFREEALIELERRLHQGFRGLKFHPWLQGLPVSLPAMDEVCELAARFDVPIIFHDGTPAYSLPSQIVLLAQRHPRTQIVLGHSGLFEHWREAAAAMAAADNLWACLCGPHLAGLRHLVRQCDPLRLLWGSDFGFGLADPIAYRLALFDEIGLTPAQRTAILDDNPRRLLRLT